MKKVALVSGPRGSGKTTYVKRFHQAHPDIPYLIRDEVLMEMFGETSLPVGSIKHRHGRDEFCRRLEKALARKDAYLVVEHWNELSGDREYLTRLFRNYGAEMVICWQFVVSSETNAEWLWKKPGLENTPLSLIVFNHEFYYMMAEEIEQDGFDRVFRIDPSSNEFPVSLFA